MGFFRNIFAERLTGFENKLPLEKFIPVAFLIFMISMIILSLNTYQSIERFRKDIELINHSNEIIKVIEEIKLKEFELPLYKKGYLIIRNENFINTFDTLIKNTKINIKELKDLTIDNPAQQELIKLLDSVTMKNIEAINSSEVEFPGNLFSQKNTDATNEIQKNLFRIDEITNKLESNELTILNSRNAEAERTNSSTQLFIIITGVFSFIVIGLSLYISDKLISARNRAEKQLSDSYGELEGRVEERTQALTESNKKLSEGIIIRGKIEDTLRESEERFRMMADSVPVMIWITDKNKQYTYINKIFLKFTGRSIEQELGKGWTDGIHEDDLKNYLNIFETSFEKREPYEIEYRLKNSEGEYIWIYDNGIPRFEGNNFVGFIGNCIDINERKRSEKYLNIQYEVSKTLIESDNLKEAAKELLCNICEGINWDFGIMWAADEKNEFINEVSNWNNDKNISAEYSKLSDVKNKYGKREGITGTVFAEGKTKWLRDISSDKVFLRKEVAQKMGWVSGIEIPISNGKDTIAIIECFSKKMAEENKDVIEVVESAGRQIGNYIERKRVEENLKRTYEQLDNKILERTSELASALTKIINESEEKERIQNRIKIFAHAIRSIKDSIFICDLDNKIIFVNRAFEETYGYMEDEILGFEIPILDNMKITEDFKKDILSKSIKEGWRGELHTQRKDGYSFITYLSTSSIKNEEVKTNAWAGICQDITDLKNSEEELKRINIKLLESQKEVIHNEKLAALGRFSSGVAHEIRNPLANISSLAQLISKASIDEKNKRRLKYIITNVEIANKIIKNLLYFASPEEPEYDFNNLNLILNDVLASVEARCKENNIKIIREIPEELSPIHIDKQKIENAFMNFISNSIEAMTEGGELSIKVSEDKVNNEMIINIIDTGEGIPEENMDKILEPFFTTKDEGVGLGMGLAYQTIKLQGGRFKIESKEGIGTKVEIKLPFKGEQKK